MPTKKEEDIENSNKKNDGDEKKEEVAPNLIYSPRWVICLYSIIPSVICVAVYANGGVLTKIPNDGFWMNAN